MDVMAWDGSRVGAGRETDKSGERRLPATERKARRTWPIGVFLLLSFAPGTLAAAGQSGPRSLDEGASNQLELPQAWQARFWNSAAAQALLRMEPRAVADLVPAQAGVKHCRCPSCGADDRDDPLSWTIEQPKLLKCRCCGVSLPDEKFPAKVKDKDEIPEETVEVVPGVVHHYPYHQVEDSKARFPDERIYLQAKIDYETRKYLAKAALYSATRYRAQPEGEREPRLAVLASVIVLRFAQVYPVYAI